MLSAAILFFAVMASEPDPGPPILHASMARSLQDFGACFTSAQDRASHPWAYMPTESGGTFTNAGAANVTQVYWLRVSEAKPFSRVQLFAGRNSSDLIEAVNKCR